MLAYFLLSGAVMTKLRTPFARFAKEEGELEGKLRFAHSRIITHSEEIAFYGGANRVSFNPIVHFARNLFTITNK